MSEIEATWGEVRPGTWVWLDPWTAGKIGAGWYQVVDVGGGAKLPAFQFSVPDETGGVLRLVKPAHASVRVRSS